MSLLIKDVLQENKVFLFSSVCRHAAQGKAGFVRAKLLAQIKQEI